MNFDLNLPYHVYCESASFFGVSQPLNILSNLAFIAGAFLLWSQDRGRGTSLSLLAMLMAVVGFAGMVWHITGQQFAAAIDIGAQLVMGAILTMILAHQILRWHPVNAVIVGVIMLLSAMLGRDLGLPFMLQNGGAFLPAMVFLVILAFVEIQRGRMREAKFLMGSAYVLFVGLIFYSLDWALCWSFPYGLHFMWHLCMALSIWLAVEAIWTDRQDNAREEKLAV